MFDRSDTPRVFALPPGADFAAALVAGLDARAAGRAPHTAARTQIYVNTRRMHRRVRGLFERGGARLLPRLLTVADIGAGMPLQAVPPATSPLTRQLELTALVSALIEAEPGLAPKSAAFDLAGSLAALIDEMAGEGVAFAAIEGLETGGASRHWADSLKFLSIVHTYLAASADIAPSPEARQRRAVDAMIAAWADAPPAHPILIAGSTGSRGTTAALMRAVTRLDQGAVILPGFDFDLPGDLWHQMLETGEEDHPQYRFARFMADLGITRDEVQPWRDGAAPAPLRNRLVSLALRPAPVTNQWLRDGPDLGDLTPACAGLSLIEAPSERHEAVAITLVLRDALARGKPAALVTPDRMLTRRVAAELDRWGIEPDDSAGRPLSQSAPGRLLIHLARQSGRRVTTEALLTLLKHPLACRDGARGPHLRWARELELWLRGRNVAYPGAAELTRWAEDPRGTAKPWAEWVAATLLATPDPRAASIGTHLARILATAEALCAGPGGGTAIALWEEPAGEAARRVTMELTGAAQSGQPIPPAEFTAILQSILARADVRDPVRPHPGVMIWGTLEARVQGAELLILGGLNEEVWPAAPAPDPWLNRAMRRAAGLLSPERQVGLAAHDFQQAIGAPEVILSRPVRRADAEPVPSRWLNRIVNLLEGLKAQRGPEALAEMRARGAAWLGQVRALEQIAEPAAPAPRPAPVPPPGKTPRQLSVTEIQTLVRDPYAIYAKHILRLPRVNPLKQMADAPLRGTLLHEVFAEFLKAGLSGEAAQDRAHLMEIAERVLSRGAPFPVAQHLWRARIARVAEEIVRLEHSLRAGQAFAAAETSGRFELRDPPFTLTARADRIDRLHGGGLAILDYKSGAAPTTKEMLAFDKQILLEALIAEEGGFAEVGRAAVDHVAYISLKEPLPYAPKGLDGSLDERLTVPAVRAGLQTLIEGFAKKGRGFTARRAIKKRGFEGDYDHLARFGEWDDAAKPRREALE